ncbi:PIN domain-containing protein [Caulobacter sp. SLTY]|uniref:PIN domain-containing protein n=1 Tax=Caulobacter sp. SLTY TaxID=2683262 RepID=UPI0014133346|nr:PIN domain-containing protein [Caulobacter sp. SLTY]
MSLVVIDASAALSWILPSQATAAAEEFLSDHIADTFVAPHIFQWEAGNILLALEWRGLLAAGDLDTALAALDGLPVMLIEPLLPAAVAGLRPLAREGQISLFDAAYLQLAADFSCGLATRDGGLVRLAGLVGIDCFDLRGVSIP